MCGMVAAETSLMATALPDDLSVLHGLLRERIQSGEITDMLPSIMELTEETGLAVGTVRRAIGVLADEGLVVTQPGRGTFVRLPS